MPGSMTHLVVAKTINPNADIDFYIGSIAPDTIMDRDKMIIYHKRNIPEPDRETALKEFALKLLKINNKNEYLKGIILHLFVDWKWDTTVMAEYAKKIGDGWLPKYREEIRMAISYTFHNTSYAYDLWKQMELCDEFDYVDTEYITKDDIKRMIQSRIKWKLENKIGPSSAFPPAVIDSFIKEAINDFNVWYSSLVNSYSQ